MRMLSRRGVFIEALLKEKDPDNRGFMSKSLFFSVTRSLGLPFSRKEINEILDRYSSPTNEIDYEALLRDAGIQLLHQSSEDVSQSVDSYGNVLIEVKRMILELVNNYGKSFDDVYGMFSCWDHDGTGSVTSTQFLRVLSRLHIELSDSDQDFLVELLDVDSMGRIDFKRLLTYCFAESSFGHLMDDKYASAELSSLSNLGSLTDNNSHGSSRRPRTASKVADAEANSSSVPSQTKSTKLTRPTTASARVSASEHAFVRSNNISNHHQHAVIDARQHYDEDRHLIIEFPDDIIDDEMQQLTPNTFVESVDNRRVFVSNGAPDSSNNVADINWAENHDLGSINDTTLVTDQEDSNFGSPMRLRIAMDAGGGYDRLPQLPNGRSGAPSQAQQPHYAQLPNQINTGYGADGVHTGYANDYPMMTIGGSDMKVLSNWYAASSDVQQHVYHDKDNVTAVGRAAQITVKLRDRLYLQYKNGTHLRELFQVFASEGRRAVTSVDLLRALAHVDGIDEDVASGVVKNIGIDGVEHFTFAEFKVFITDHEHKDLELAVQHQMAQQLERLGRQFQLIVNSIFLDSEQRHQIGSISKRLESSQDSHSSVSIPAFREGLTQLGLRLSPTDIQRLVTRFDLHEEGFCSVTRFVRCVQRSVQWQNAERVLTLQDEAVAEAAHIRERQREGQFTDISEELLAMAEFLGIRPISEQQLLWIAVDALRAPLPINWSAQKDSEGRIYFYNHISNQSRWDHPLDSHFRMLRDEYRYRWVWHSLCYLLHFFNLVLL
jgi:Ca2+-binding EF-hand superfamily protein